MKKSQVPLDSDDGEEGGDEWLLTYGDLMTQLVCFFVLLMSFSIISSMKFRDVVVSLQDSLNGNGVLSSWMSVADDLPRSFSRNNGSLMELKAELDEKIKVNNMSDSVETEVREEGLVITLTQGRGSVFFNTGDAVIKEEAYPILNQLGRILKSLPNKLRIEGHTDIRPIHTAKFPSNWELSAARATNVLRYLSNVVGIAPERLSAVGYGPYKPIASNDTEAGMAKNRRVEIVVLCPATVADDG